MRVARYGSWTSPLTAARVTAGTLRFDHIVIDGADAYWIEGRASDGGRNVVVRRSADGSIADVTPTDFNVRSRVHEYGGAAYCVHQGTLFFSNFADQRVYRQAPGSEPVAIGTEGCFYADGYVDAARGRLLMVREDHRQGGEPVNTIVSVAFDGSREMVVAAGADFYSDPTVSPDGTHLAWLEWRHPNMPWDGTQLFVAEFAPDGTVNEVRQVAGGATVSVFQPTWSPDGVLYFVSDLSGWSQLHRSDVVSGNHRSLDRPVTLGLEAEFAKPQWSLSASTFAFVDAHRIAAAFTRNGRWSLALIDARLDGLSLNPSPGAFAEIFLDIEPIDSVKSDGTSVFFIGGSPTEPLAICRVEVATRRLEIVRSSSTDRIDPSWISVPEAITFDSNGDSVHAFLYEPQNPDYVAPPSEKPPLLVLSHGGPTDAANDVLDGRIQFWTSRGFAVVNVNYGGSTGYGRNYRIRLNANWGVVDVSDCVNAARHLANGGRVDPARLIIRGGSAGGYTTLAALTFHDTFAAGASYYGISDIEVLAHDTHKFESRYLDGLIGHYPTHKELYRQRSPIHYTERLSKPLILFQGLEDKVVPPSQSEMMTDVLRRKGVPVAYVAFRGEQHGFRKAENMVRSLEAELYFYGAVFGFAVADPIEPVVIDNLR